jgi:hypothetical protein
MTSRNTGLSVRRSNWLVRSWFALVSLAAMVMTGALVYDYIWGEGIAHLGLAWFINLSLLCLAALGAILLPLLVTAVILEHKSRS